MDLFSHKRVESHSGQDSRRHRLPDSTHPSPRKLPGTRRGKGRNAVGSIREETNHLGEKILRCRRAQTPQALDALARRGGLCTRIRWCASASHKTDL